MCQILYNYRLRRKLFLKKTTVYDVLLHRLVWKRVTFFVAHFFHVLSLLDSSGVQKAFLLGVKVLKKVYPDFYNT